MPNDLNSKKRNPIHSNVKSSFFNLTPDRVLEAIESQGYWTTGRYRFLNSYENRVFDVELENETSPLLKNEMHQDKNLNSIRNSNSIIAKFYRPGRWSQDCILEEHSFINELHLEGLPVASPLILKNNSTLIEHEGLFFSLFPKIQGRMVEEILPHQVPHLARWLARLHNVGCQKKTQYRPSLYANTDRIYLLESHIPIEIWSSYFSLAESIFNFLNSILPDYNLIRLHGDFHRGNLLWNNDWTLIDFDDFLMGPAAQDFWIILSQLEEADQEVFIESYDEIRQWNHQEFALLEPLRAYRIINYSTWIAERWEDPSFPHLFPSFHEYNFWSNELLTLQKIYNTILN